MEKWADYLISKEKWLNTSKTIDSFMVHSDNGTSVGLGEEKNRVWIIQQIRIGKTFCCIYLREDGAWYKGSVLTLNTTGGLKWSDDLPIIQTKRKTFISYYHHDDQSYKEKFENLTSDLIVNKSVQDGDINSDNSDEYIKQLIQKEFLKDTTVLIVLIGQKTKCRKHIDWEISGALNLKVGDQYAGILGLLLPSHVDYGKNTYSSSNIPERLANNLDSGYAVIGDYTTDRKKIQLYIEMAFRNRTSKSDKWNNTKIQMKKNSCD